jgi:hypothetical protein
VSGSLSGREREGSVECVVYPKVDREYPLVEEIHIGGLWLKYSDDNPDTSSDDCKGREH